MTPKGQNTSNCSLLSICPGKESKGQIPGHVIQIIIYIFVDRSSFRGICCSSFRILCVVRLFLLILQIGLVVLLPALVGQSFYF